jgi:ABC-type multidrug transport system ATPase subunit
MLSPAAPSPSSQHDILWENLTAFETLLFYGRLKCLTGKALDAAVVGALVAVDLAKKAHVRVGSFSGGMKRRLSVACALIGNPKVIYLDEPSTGLDPASRHKLWDVISNAKASGESSIVLTTHHLEEAEVLCDRVGIMSGGEMRCIGTAPALRRRFGRGYTLTVTLSSGAAEAADELLGFVVALLPSARLLGTPMGGTSKFEVMKEDVLLSAVFRQFEARRDGSGGGGGMVITDWGIYQTSLEEVFLKVTALAERGIPCTKERSLSFLARHLDANSEAAEEDVRGVGIVKVVQAKQTV